MYPYAITTTTLRTARGTRKRSTQPKYTTLWTKSVARDRYGKYYMKPRAARISPETPWPKW